MNDRHAVERLLAAGGQVTLNGARLAGVDLSGLDLSGADLSYADLSYARLDDATLRRAVLWAAVAPEASLVRADLREANLSVANLRGANLTDARLAGARLAGTDLTGATLTGAELPAEGLAGAITDAGTHPITQAAPGGGGAARPRVEVGAADDGRQVTVPVGGLLRVLLPERPGSRWRLVETGGTGFAATAHLRPQPPSSVTDQPGLRLVEFEAVTRGRAELLLARIPLAAPDAEAVQRYALTVHVE